MSGMGLKARISIIIRQSAGVRTAKCGVRTPKSPSADPQVRTPKCGPPSAGRKCGTPSAGPQVRDPKCGNESAPNQFNFNLPGQNKFKLKSISLSICPSGPKEHGGFTSTCTVFSSGHPHLVEMQLRDTHPTPQIVPETAHRPPAVGVDDNCRG